MAKRGGMDDPRLEELSALQGGVVTRRQLLELGWTGDQVDGRRSRYRDVHDADFHVVVELDGQEAPPAEEGFRDRARDDDSTVARLATLRYGRRETAGRPCAVAAQVAEVLSHHGWTGRPLPCSPACPLGP